MNRKPLYLVALLVGPMVASGAAAAEGVRLSADQPYTAERSEPITHRIDFAAVVTPPYHCKVLKVWLPLPPSNALQEVTTESCTSFPAEVAPQIHTEPKFGNRFAYFEFHDPKGAQIIRHRFTAKLWQADWRMDLREVPAVTQWPDEFAAYLEQAPLMETPAFTRVLDTFRTGGEHAAGDLLSAMQWIDANMTYDHAHASLQADGAFAFRERRGHCSDYHGLCSLMSRALGYPSRVTYGLALIPKNSPSHCKIEVYLPPYGWVSFDLSESQKMLRAIEQDKQLSDAERTGLLQAVRRRLFSGYRENSWLLVTRGSSYQLAPEASAPVSVVRTIYAEADGERLPEPDPANPSQREFSWMTVHKYEADKPFHLYTDRESLAAYRLRAAE